MQHLGSSPKSIYVSDDHEDHEILSLCERHNLGISGTINSSSNKVYIFSKAPLNIEEYRSVNATNYIIDRFLLLASSKETIEENRNAFRDLDIIDLMNFWVANDHLNTQKLKVLNDPDTSWIDLVSNNFVLQGMLAERGEIIVDIFSPEGSEVLGVADGKGGIQ